MRVYIVLLIVITVSGCLGKPQGVKPVAGFELNKYLGTWYEIARLDHSFERGLDRVSAEYSLREDGGVKVVNRGYSSKKGKWRESTGKAYFVNEPGEGYLKVSFFGPFYGSYIIFGLDKIDYQYAFISGPDNSYLWLLSRSPSTSNAVIERFVNKSKQLGFDTGKLVYVKHE